MPLSPVILIYALIFATAFLVMQLIQGAGRHGARKIKLANLRMHLRAKNDSQSEVLNILRKSRGIDDQSRLATSKTWLNQQVLHSGLPLNENRIYYIIPANGAVFAVLGFIFSRSFTMAGITLVIGLILPILVVVFAARRRRSKAISQLPDALDVIVRSLKAGHPVPVAIDLVAREMPDPIGSEFGMASDEITYGTELGIAIQRLAERVGHGDFEMLAATVRLQEKTGGNLTELLGNNAKMVRDRQKMRLKIKAASSEGRMSALILNVVPFILFAAINIISPEFYGNVRDVPFVKHGLMAAMVWMFIGNLVIRKMINFKI